MTDQRSAVERAPGRTLLPTPGAFLFTTLALVVLTIRSLALLNTDGDLARHLRVGTHMLRARSILDADMFSHTMYGQPFVPYEWLSEVMFALAYAWRGLPGVTIMSALMVATMGMLVYTFMERRGADPLLSLMVAVVAAVISSIHWLARPHLFTMLAAIVLLHLLQRSDRRAHVWTVILFALWTNLHGGFVYGLVLIGLFLVGDLLELRFGSEPAAWRARARQHATMLGWASAATLLNPAGIMLHAHVLGYLRNKYLVDHTMEYMSPDFHLAPLQLFLAVVALVVLLLGLNRRRLAGPALIVVVVNLAFALYSARNIPLFAVTALPLLGVHFDPDWRALPARWLHRMRAALDMGVARGSTLPWIGLVALLLIGIGFNHGRVAGVPVTPRGFSAEKFPIAAVQKARAAALPGRIFNEFRWGGYLLHAWPEQRVFIDGQTDFYGEALTREYQKIIGLEPGWRAVLDKWRIGLIIVPASSALAAEVAMDKDWNVWYRDDVAVILVRAMVNEPI